MSAPRTWKRTRIDRVATVNARIGWKALTASEYRRDGYAFLATPNIKSETIDFENVNYIDEFRYEESPELKLEPGDVLLAKDGNTLGITNVIRELPKPSTVNGSIAILRAYDVDPCFLRYSLASDSTQSMIDAIKGGMGVPHLFQWDIKRLPITIPPTDEQHRIAEFLDSETSHIDGLIEKKRRMVSLLDERERAFIQQVSPGSMVRGRDGRPVGISGMECARLGALAVIQSGFTMDAGRDKGTDSLTLPYLRVANVHDGSLALGDINEVTLPRTLAERCTLRAGDVLMTEGGDPDKLGRGTVWPGDIQPCLHQNAIFAIRPDSRLLPEYLALVTRTTYARAYFEMTASKSTGIAHTSSTKISGFRVPMYTVTEQRRLVDRIIDALVRTKELREPAERQLNLLVERRQALITAAVTGQIDVTTARGGAA